MIKREAKRNITYTLPSIRNELYNIVHDISLNIYLFFLGWTLEKNKAIAHIRVTTFNSEE